MAELYVGDRFWDTKQMQEVTVRTTGTVDRKQWIQEMTDWADSHHIFLRWQGESTHDVNGESWHEAYFLIRGEKNRTLFRLRWA